MEKNVYTAVCLLLVSQYNSVLIISNTVDFSAVFFLKHSILKVVLQGFLQLFGFSFSKCKKLN